MQSRAFCFASPELAVRPEGTRAESGKWHDQRRDDLLTIEQRWLFLADGFECLESLGRFLVGAPQAGRASDAPRPSATPIDWA
jgi:hypothetical protein